MPKQLKKKRPADVNQLAHALVRESTDTDDAAKPVTPAEVSRVMATMGRKGGRIGGKRRLETMTPEARSEVALKAARARWAKRKRDELTQNDQ